MTASHECEGRIEAAHIRTGTDGGMGKKPSDCWVVPLCSWHHKSQHSVGENSFWKSHGFTIDQAKAEAARLWKQSPHHHKSKE